MQVILRQTFPLGRFHATPWRVSPFDDPHGEWPPSPFRLVRAVVARFHQLARERGEEGENALEGLVRALVTSEIQFHLPPSATRGPAIRQYLPDVELKWIPAGKKDQAKGAMKVSARSLAQDNCIAVPPEEPVYWFLDGPDWNDARLAVLDACLSRMTYFGRAESVTMLGRVKGVLPAGIEINCKVVERRQRDAVPVLCATSKLTAALASVETSSEGGALPPGTVWRFAVRPSRPAPHRAAVSGTLAPRSLIQFAVGTSVEPPLAAVATLTGWFRGRVLREALTSLNGGVLTRWSDAPDDLRGRVADLAGKDADGRPLEGHAHARYLVWRDGERTTRLFVYRRRPFDGWEQEAILRAGEAPLGWSQTQSEGWSVRLVPLDSAVPRPPGFDEGRHRRWCSVTPFVPSRHFLDRRGRAKKGETIEDQIAEELTRHGFPPAVLGAINDGDWVRVHAPKRGASEATNNSRRSFQIQLTFRDPVAGPLMLGHSSFFGLGLFAPMQ